MKNRMNNLIVLFGMIKESWDCFEKEVKESYGYDGDFDVSHSANRATIDSLLVEFNKQSVKLRKEIFGKLEEL